MTVKELIKRLKEYPENSEVFVYSEDKGIIVCKVTDTIYNETVNSTILNFNID